MNELTLILTPDYRPANFLPLSVVSWQDCIRLLVLDKIKPLEMYENRFIHSARMAIQLPAVAVTKDWKGFKRHTRFSRSGLFVRDLFTCQYCNDIFESGELTIDHVIPRSQGGKTTWENCVTACKECNYKKGSKLWRPNCDPWKQDYHALAARRRQLPFNVGHHSWYTYLGIEPPAEKAA